MTVGVLLITHSKLGKHLLKVSDTMLGKRPLVVKTLGVSEQCNVDKLSKKARKLRRQLDQGDGVLVLTDIYGSTPCNIANSVVVDEQTKVVAGVNLPMLIRVMNYPNLSLTELTDKAISGGHNGIFLSQEATLDNPEK